MKKYVRRRNAFGAVLLISGLLLVPLISGHALPRAVAANSQVTITGDNPAWDPLNAQPLPDLPTVTVSQTANLVDQVVHVSWTNFTPSSNDLLYSSAPTPPVTFQPGNVLYPVEVVECKGTNPTHSFLDDTAPDCYSFTPGDPTADHGAGNAIQTITGPDGTGSADIHIETAAANDFLGCSDTSPCSLAVVPNWGGSQPSGGTADCSDHTNDFPTAANGYNYPPFADAADDHLGAACSWGDRIVVPLQFAPTAQDCPTRSDAFSAAGSPMLYRALAQWQAGWCAASAPLSFGYDSSSNEYTARTNFLADGSGALTSATDVALVSEPADTASAAASKRTFTYAPVATTAIVVAFVIDDPTTGQVVSKLNLNARLLAKLLTESYSLYNFNCTQGGGSVQSATCDPAVSGNPASIFSDPEFLALNPQLSAADFPSPGENAIGAFLPTVVGGNSDLVYELTRWIAQDPSASAFLAGQPDQWGMTVNSYYRGVSYPTPQLQQLDPGFTDPTAPPGNGTMQNAWQPVNGLDTVGNLLVSNTTSTLSNSVSACAAAPCPFPKVTELPGNRALFAILDAGQAAAYAFPTAALVNAAGDAVNADTPALSAAIGDMTANPDGVTGHLAASNTDARAYPLTTVDYAMVPTCGLSTAKANSVAAFLDQVSGSQIYGTAPGQLAPGYQALNAAQLAQTAAAAKAVRNHSGCAVSPSATPSVTSSGSTTRLGPVPGGGLGAVPPVGSLTGGITPSGGAGTTVHAVARSGTGTTSSTDAPTTAPTDTPTVAALGLSSADRAGTGGMILPVLLIVGALLLIGGPGVYVVVATGVGPAVRRLLTGLLRR